MLYIEDKLERVYKEMHIPQDFGGDIDNDDFYNVEDMVYDLKRATGLDIDYEHGVSKAVLLIPGVDKVLKIPFNGYYECHMTNEDEYYETLSFLLQIWLISVNSGKKIKYCVTRV